MIVFLISYVIGLIIGLIIVMTILPILSDKLWQKWQDKEDDKNKQEEIKQTQRYEAGLEYDRKHGIIRTYICNPSMMKIKK